jgi:hypothetical protein
VPQNVGFHFAEPIQNHRYLNRKENIKQARDSLLRLVTADRHQISYPSGRFEKNGGSVPDAH